MADGKGEASSSGGSGVGGEGWSAKHVAITAGVAVGGLAAAYLLSRALRGGQKAPRGAKAKEEAEARTAQKGTKKKKKVAASKKGAKAKAGAARDATSDEEAARDVLEKGASVPPPRKSAQTRKSRCDSLIRRHSISLSRAPATPHRRALPTQCPSRHRPRPSRKSWTRKSRTPRAQLASVSRTA
jgi:hypothetical protein